MIGDPVVCEQDFINTNPPATVGYWSEEEIRRYYETHGVDTGKSVFQRGEKPCRVWSNDRYFTKLKSEPEPVQYVRSEVHEEPSEPTVQSLMAQLEEMKRQLAQNQKVVHVSPQGVKRHTEPVIKEKKLDKRSREYRVSIGRSPEKKHIAGIPEGE